MKKLFAILAVFLASTGLAWATVNINTATQAELETLNGIGPTKAKAIIDYRTKNGNFKSLDDVEKVPGVGPGTLEKIKSEVTLAGKTTVVAEKVADKPAKAEKAAKEEKPAKAEKTDKPGKSDKK